MLVVLASSPLAIPAGDSLHVQIDQWIAAKADGPMAPLADDAEFMRRVYLDLAGRIPSVGEARSFLSDMDEGKREKLIDRLLASDEYAFRMSDLFNVMLLERLGDHEDWTRFLTESFRANKPWDGMVREILYPNPESESTRGAALFFTKRLEHYGENPVDYPGLVRDVGRLFLGVDVQCAQCHDHLFIEEYKQEDYQGLFAFVGQAVIREDLKFPAVGENLVTKKIAFQSVFVQQEKSTGPRLPRSPEVEIPVMAKGEEYEVTPDKKKRFPGLPKFSPLKILSEQLPRADNELFSRNITNRLWWMLMGRGLVTPLDMHHSQNPPTHPELMDLLAREFAAHQFDIQWMLRELALSETYQRSSLLPEGATEVSAASYRSFIEKPLSSEQVVSSVLQSLGRDEPLGGSASAANDKSDKSGPANPVISKEIRERFAKAFANPPREPEVDHNPTLKAALFVMNDAAVLERFKAQPGNLVDRLVRQSDACQIAEEMYLAILSRMPADDEREEITEFLSSDAERREVAVGQLAWSLVASTEFAVNH